MHIPTGPSNTTCDASPITYAAACCRGEREEAFELVYRAYLQSELARPNPVGMRILPHHLLSTTEVFVAKDEGEVVSTVTLIRDGELGLPMEEVYPDEIEVQRLQNKRIGEVSCLASVEQLNLKICLELFRVMVQAARERGLNALLVAIHPKHERFYRRYLAFESLGGRTNYPSVCNQPAVALMLDFDRIDIERPANWERFFGQPLPTETLRESPQSVADKQHFARLLAQCIASTSRESAARSPSPLPTLAMSGSQSVGQEHFVDQVCFH